MEKNLFINETINIGSDIQITIKELASRIIDLTNRNVRITYLPALEEGDMTRRQPEIIKMRRLLDRELTTLEEGLKKLINSRQFMELNEIRG